MPRVTYTIPEPERELFRALAAKTQISEAEHIRRYIRWACSLAKVSIPTASGAPAENVQPYIPTDSADDSTDESAGALPALPLNQALARESLPVNGLTADG